MQEYSQDDSALAITGRYMSLASSHRDPDSYRDSG